LHIHLFASLDQDVALNIFRIREGYAYLSYNLTPTGVTKADSSNISVRIE